MEKEYFLSAGIPPPGMHGWTSELPDCSSEQAPVHYLNPNWDKQNDHFGHMDSGFGSMASSSHSPDSGVPPDAFVLRELIRKMDPLQHSSGQGQHFPAAHASTSGNFTSYAPPLSSNSPLTQLHAPMLRNPVPVNPGLPSLTADPGFAERAAKFSCFGSRSFNGRTTQFVTDMPYRSSAAPAMENVRLPRVLSSPVLKQGGIPAENGNSGQPHMESSPTAGNGCVFPAGASSNEESSLSEQVPSGGETGLKSPQEPNSRKRKAVSRGKAKEDANKGTENDADKNVKRPKESEAVAMEIAAAKTKAEEEAKTNEDTANQKPLPEPPKDYIHVRARRGQATDSHSLAERVRREKISERMKLLQDLVPGCNKVTGKALMLDEIINYVQSLQRQVEFLSMKLASVNPRLDSMDNILPKDGFQPNAALFPLETSDPALYKNQNQNQNQTQHHQSQQLQNHISMEQGNNPGLSRNMGMQLASLDGFIESLPQFASFSEDDLHSIVQMGYGQDGSFLTQTFPSSNQTSHMKIEI